MRFVRWFPLLGILLLVGCGLPTPPPEQSSSQVSSIPTPPSPPEDCIPYGGDWPVSFYYDRSLTLAETEDAITLTAQQGEDALSIELTRSGTVMADFAPDFDFDGDLDRLIQSMDEEAAAQGTPFQLAQRLYGCGYPASWFQRQLKSDRWDLTIIHCFLYRQPEALLLESTATSGFSQQGEEWLLEIVLSLRANGD